MRKLKTIILSLVLMTASAFMTGCTCFGGGDDELTVVQDTGISIECVELKYGGKDDDKAPASKLPVTDKESGNIIINCNRNDTFTIRYTLSPENVTTTTVTWDIDNDSVVAPEKKETGTSYSKTYQEDICKIY